MRQNGLRILYGVAKQAPPDGDLYEIPGYEPYREEIKKVCSAMSYADGPQTRFPKGARGRLRCRFSQLSEAIRAQHQPIADLLYRGLGLRTMFIESQIMVHVLLELLGRGIPALPIHDAVLLPASAEEEGRSTMLEMFCKYAGVEGVVSTTTG